jgi:hypothetical protein
MPAPLEPPSDSSAPTAGSTPAKIRNTATELGYTSHLSQNHKAAISNLGRVPQIPLDTMMEMLMPSRLSNDDVDGILRDLQGCGFVANSKWAVFDPNPSASSEREPTYFYERLPRLHRDIVDSKRRVTPGSLSSTPIELRLRMSRSQTLFRERRSTSQPDGYYVLWNATIDWYHIAIPIEVKKRTRGCDVNDVCLSY